MGLNIGRGGSCTIGCDVSGCKEEFGPVYGQSKIMENAKKAEWSKDSGNGKWSCPNCQEKKKN